MSDSEPNPWESGKIVKRALKARAFRKVDRRDIREVEIEVVKAPLVKAPAPAAGVVPPPPVLAKDTVRQTPPQTIPVAEAFVREPQKPGARLAEGPSLPSGALPGARMDQGPVQGALLAVADALYKDIGHPGTILQTPKGIAFSVRRDVGTGEVHTHHTLTVPLPEGHTTSHPAAIAIELENRASLVLDVLPSHASLTEVKAHAFDALQFRRNSRCFTVLVFLRVPGPGLTQEQVESIAHGYDLVFGIEEEHARTEARYAALRSRIVTWLGAAAKA